MVGMAGRPITFDRDAALQTALHAFWERGFAGTSVAHLTEAMGIAAPSLYAAFGDKRQLFDEAAGHYLARLDLSLADQLSAPSLRDAIEGVLRSAADYYTTDGHPRGCLVMSEPLMARQRAQARDVIGARIRRGEDDGDLPPGSDVEGLTEFVDVLIAGMSARARDGATRQQLDAAIHQALVTWPNSPPRDRRRQPRRRPATKRTSGPTPVPR